MSSTDTNECQAAILACLAQVPPGKVCSYGRIASLSGFPGKARYVAYILKKLPKDTSIPWYRIINSQGDISFPKESSKYKEQYSLLKNEGVQIPLSKKALREYLWLND